MYSLVPKHAALTCPAVVVVSVYLSIKQAAPTSLRGKFEYLYLLPDFMYFQKECVSTYGSREAATKGLLSHTIPLRWHSSVRQTQAHSSGGERKACWVRQWRAGGFVTE